MVWRTTYAEVNKENGWEDKDNWILTDRTQVNELSGEEPKQQLVIGLDFGTAYTKVVIGEQRIKYAVPFQHFSSEDNPFLLPSKLAIINQQEECLFGDITNSVQIIDDLKMRFLNRDFSEVSKVYIASYIALVLRFVRGWLLDTHRAVYKGRQLNWMVNIGLPTANYDDEELSKAYGDIVQTAWGISVLPGPITIPRVREYLYKIVIHPEKIPEPYASRFLNRDLITPLPEFAVQLAGYVRSPRRQESLHLLIDVGAGTFDITSFNIYRDRESGEDLYPIFANEVKQLGVRFLLAHREAKIEGCKPLFSPFGAIPQDNEFSRSAGIELEELESIDRSFESNVSKLILEVLQYTKEKRYRIYTQWQNGVPTFYCGGGASVDFYRIIFRKFEERSPPFKFTRIRLDAPEDLEHPGLPENTYDRLSVAYGLSHDPFDIGEIRKKSEVPDEEDPEHKDKLCPRCNGSGGPTGGCLACNGSGWIKGT